MSVLKTGSASTLDIIRTIKERLPRIRGQLRLRGVVDALAKNEQDARLVLELTQALASNLDFRGIDSPGSMQSHWVAPARVVVPLPPGLSLEAAALAEPTAVAVHDVGRRSGHALNNKLLRTLIDTSSAWREVTFESLKDAPISYVAAAARV